ncbi:hypothetical protein QJS10_CPA10g01640 [Acorus calamus]|uniref:Uncharacterized protein n=1 Tax=Acorus calamus TaxID=4465 RepID=A0AAV9E169_ACOCL|nr:hypothetical protein QJS10_CPA10g01640 [Acorus calamus]
MAHVTSNPGTHLANLERRSVEVELSKQVSTETQSKSASQGQQRSVNLSDLEAGPERPNSNWALLGRPAAGYWPPPAGGFTGPSTGGDGPGLFPRIGLHGLEGLPGGGPVSFTSMLSGHGQQMPGLELGLAAQDGQHIGMLGQFYQQIGQVRPGGSSGGSPQMHHNQQQQQQGEDNSQGSSRQ